ncbi:hypothetical protein IG631_13082 [Alternaria alternata]|nr:hypothetical protein IG631_13082 [Alternaria alternata]
MTDLLQVLPDFDAKPYTHLLPSLDKALITSNDLLTLDAADVAKRAQLPAAEVRKLADAVIAALHHQLGFGGEEAVGNSFLSASGNPDTTEHGWTCISTLDQELDAALGGGIPRGYLVEVTGERYVSMGLTITVSPRSCQIRSLHIYRGNTIHDPSRPTAILPPGPRSIARRPEALTIACVEHTDPRSRITGTHTALPATRSHREA